MKLFILHTMNTIWSNIPSRCVFIFIIVSLQITQCAWNWHVLYDKRYNPHLWLVVISIVGFAIRIAQMKFHHVYNLCIHLELFKNILEFESQSSPNILGSQTCDKHNLYGLGKSPSHFLVVKRTLRACPVRRFLPELGGIVKEGGLLMPHESGHLAREGNLQMCLSPSGTNQSHLVKIGRWLGPVLL